MTPNDRCFTLHPQHLPEEESLQIRRLRGDLQRIALFARNSLARAHFDMADWRGDMEAVADEAKRASEA